MYCSQISRKLYPEEQKGYHKRTRGTGALLCIDQYILKKSKTGRKTQAMVWIDNKKAHGKVPRSWIIDFLKMYKIADEVYKIYRGNHEKLKDGTESR